MLKDKIVNDWYRGVGRDDTEAREARRAELAAAVPALRVLKEILERDIASERSAQIKEQRYDEAHWAYRQAHYNGSILALENILKKLPLEY